MRLDDLSPRGSLLDTTPSPRFAHARTNIDLRRNLANTVLMLRQLRDASFLPAQD
jgi:hypothetical protein